MKNEGLFFYRDPLFQEKSRQIWGKQLYTIVDLNPEKFSTFWDNICTNHKKGKTEYAAEECAALKTIPLARMQIEFTPKKELRIFDRDDEDNFAILDYRDSLNGELRGQKLAEVLSEYAKTHKEGSVYSALNDLINSHQHPAFTTGARFISKGTTFDARGQNIAFQTINAVLKEPNKLAYKEKTTEEYTESEALISERYPAFLKELDRNNIQDIKNTLASTQFQGTACAQQRETAITSLLSYRSTLFEETNSDTINLKDPRKADKCHFSEQMITALLNNEPKPGQNFKDYVKECVKNAEAHLTPEEASNWPKGIISHRLRDIVDNIHKMEAPIPQQRMGLSEL